MVMGAVCEGTGTASVETMDAHFVGDGCEPRHTPRWGHIEPDGTHAFTSSEALAFLSRPCDCPCHERLTAEAQQVIPCPRCKGAR